MTNQELANKLSSLKNIAPDQAWLEQNRVLLLAQISNSGAETLPAWRMAVINFASFTRAAARPATAFAAFFLMLLAGGVYSQQIFAQARPNDSLYIARILSERVRLSATFNEEERDKLAVQYAASHVQEISAVLADPEFNKEENKEKVAKLSDNFQAEVETVKQGIVRLSAKSQAASPAAAPAALPAEDNLEVMIANNNKEEQGIEVQETARQLTPAAFSTATTSPAAKAPAVSQLSAEAGNILEEAKQLFEAKDYEKASLKIKQVNELINN